jgi:hypothetical protein
VNEAHGETAAQEPRDRFIPLRKSDIVGGLVAEGRLDDAQQARFRQFARMLGAIFHYQYFEELDRLREAYFCFDPEVDPKACGSANDLEAAYRRLSDEFVRVLTEANFIEITHDEITRAFAEHALVRVKIKAPVEDYRDVRMFRRGHHKETVDIPVWFGWRRRLLEVEVYDDLVMMVATKPDGVTPAEPRKAFRSAKRGQQKIRSGAVLFKYFRHIARRSRGLVSQCAGGDESVRPVCTGCTGACRRCAHPAQARFDHDGIVCRRRLLSRSQRHDAR